MPCHSTIAIFFYEETIVHSRYGSFVTFSPCCTASEPNKLTWNIFILHNIYHLHYLFKLCGSIFYHFFLNTYHHPTKYCTVTSTPNFILTSPSPHLCFKFQTDPPILYMRLQILWKFVLDHFQMVSTVHTLYSIKGF